MTTTDAASHSSLPDEGTSEPLLRASTEHDGRELLRHAGRRGQRPGRGFRKQGRHWFLTYPQCGDLQRDRVLARLSELWGKPSSYAVAQEKHEDGGFHIHAYLDWGTRREITAASFFDVDGHHPNIQTARSAKLVQQYVLKHDEHAIQQLGGSTSTVYHRLVEGTLTVVDAVSEEPRLLKDFGRLRQNVQDYQHYKRAAAARITTWPLRFQGRDLPLLDVKCRHYWIWGGPSTGKTTWLDTNRTAKWFPIPKDGWWDGYDDQYFDVIYCDEYNADSMPFNRLNELCDVAGGLPLRIKHGTVYKYKNIIVIICSNRTPRQMYPDDWESIEARFNVIEAVRALPIVVEDE